MRLAAAAGAVLLVLMWTVVLPPDRTRFAPGTASKAAYGALRRHGFRRAERGPSFFVTATAGPLADGERHRAEAWGARLGSDLAAGNLARR